MYHADHTLIQQISQEKFFLKHLNIQVNYKNYKTFQYINLKHKWVEKKNGFAYFVYRDFIKKSTIDVALMINVDWCQQDRVTGFARK